MPGKPVQGERQGPGEAPPVNTLLIDVRQRVGEFRGEWQGLWYLRPVTGGREWAVEPGDVRPVSRQERMRALAARANARSRGELL